MAATAAAPAATVIGTRKRFQCSQAAPAATAPATAPMMPRKRFIVVEPAFADGSGLQLKPAVSEHAADKGQQQQDRRQRHAALGGEEQRQAPGGRGDRQPGRAGLDRRSRSPSPCDWPIDWPIQPTANSRIALAIDDEDVVEAGDEAEIFFVDRGRGPLAVDEGAKRSGGVGAERARMPPPRRGRSGCTWTISSLMRLGSHRCIIVSIQRCRDRE